MSPIEPLPDFQFSLEGPFGSHEEVLGAAGFPSVGGAGGGSGGGDGMSASTAMLGLGVIQTVTGFVSAVFGFLAGSEINESRERMAMDAIASDHSLKKLGNEARSDWIEHKERIVAMTEKAQGKQQESEIELKTAEADILVQKMENEEGAKNRNIGRIRRDYDYGVAAV